MLQNTGHAAAIGDKGFWSHTLISITHLTDSQHFDLQNIAAHLQPDCSPTAARLQLVAGSIPFKRQHPVQTPASPCVVMDLQRDRVYDLDLDSFIGTTPMPGALLGCPPELRDGWSDQVRVPGGLKEDDIQALGERMSTQQSAPSSSRP